MYDAEEARNDTLFAINEQSRKWQSECEKWKCEYEKQNKPIIEALHAAILKAADKGVYSISLYCSKCAVEIGLGNYFCNRQYLIKYLEILGYSIKIKDNQCTINWYKQGE